MLAGAAEEELRVTVPGYNGLSSIPPNILNPSCKVLPSLRKRRVGASLMPLQDPKTHTREA
jgi:hypothetical protein